MYAEKTCQRTECSEGEAGQDDAQGIAQGAEADPRDMSLQARHQQLNEQGGEKCVCGRWEDYARVDGGWAAVDMEYEWGEEGDHGCENVAAGWVFGDTREDVSAVQGRASGRVR